MIDEVEYQGMAIPAKFQELLGHVTKEQLAYYIAIDKHMDESCKLLN